MARFIFSNNSEMVKKYVDHCQTVGLKKYTAIEKANFSGAVFSKLCVDNINVIQKGDDVMAAIGTYFYKEKMAEQALELIYSDLKSGKPLYEIRNTMDGNFAIAVYQEGKLYTMSDPLGIHYLYYYFDKESHEWIIGNSLYEMAKLLPRTCTCNEFNLMEDTYQYGIWGGQSLLNEFPRVEGDSMLVVDTVANELTVKTGMTPKYEINTSSFEELTQNMANDIRSLYNMAAEGVGKDNISLFMTGGLDSRTALAGLLSCGVKPHLYYGVGNSLLTNTKAPDLAIDRMYEKEFGLELTVLDYKNELPLDKEWDEQLHKFGLLDHFSTVTPNQRRAFISVKEPIVFYGINGEAFRNEMPILEHAEKDNYSIEEIRDNYYIPDQGYMGKVFGERFEDYKGWLKTKMSRTMAPYLNNDGTIPRDYCAAYYLQCMVAHDTHKNNLLNQFRYCVTLGGNYRLMKYVLAPTPMKDDSKIILGVIDKLYPALLDMPFFSRYGYRQYDREKNSMIVHQTTEQLNMASWGTLRNMVYKTRLIFPQSFRDAIKKMLKYLKDPKGFKDETYRTSLTKERIVKELEMLIDKYPMYQRKTSIMQSSFLPREAHLALNLKALDKLGIKKLQK